jgi:hypothetical protein
MTIDGLPTSHRHGVNRTVTGGGEIENRSLGVKDANCGGLEQSTQTSAKAVPPGTRHMPDTPAKKKR